MKATTKVIKLVIDDAPLVKQLEALRLLVSQIGFALDNYLVTAHQADTEGSVEHKKGGGRSV